MDRLKMHSLNKVEENIKKIAELFPNTLTEVIKGYDKDGRPVIGYAIDFDVLRQELSDIIVEGPEERYQFTWPDKRKSILLANTPVTKTLRPCREESVNFDMTSNLYIEGDNLDVLKLLQESYRGRIKLIYIDPPYNTGNDFVYDDNFVQSENEYLAKSGKTVAEGSLLANNPDSGGRFHTDWLNMMYPRLMLARDLLSEEGAIFVSIDYNEAENLKKIMDEIFGRENFQREIIWRIGWLSGFKTAASNFIRNHDTLLFYSKDHTRLKFIKKYIENKDFKPLVRKTPKLVSRLTELGLTRAQQKKLLHFINHENRPKRYPIEDTWNCNEYDDLNSIAIVSYSGEKISKILGIDQDFKGQKPVRMLKRILEAITSGDDIVMDFFSGTASTAHAVMQLNAEDGGKRKFIMVQIPEPCDEKSEAYKAGYRTISDIGKERLRRVGKKIMKDFPHTAEKLDTGFRVLKLDTGNMEEFYYNTDFAKNPNSLPTDCVKAGRTHEDLLFQVMLDLGVPLSAKIEELTIYGNKVYNVADRYLMACFEKCLTDEAVTEIAKKHPYYAVFRENPMSNGSNASDFKKIFETFSPSTIIKVL